MKLTPRENLIRAARRQGFDWVPIDLLLCDSQVKSFKQQFGHTDYFDWFGVDFRWVELKENPGYTDPKKLYPREILPESTEFDVLGLGHSKGSEAAYHMTRMHHPLAGADSVEEIMNYPLPVVRREENQALFDEVDRLHRKGLAAMCMMQMTIWEASWYIRSMEDMLMDMMTEDEKATILLDKIVDYQVNRATIHAHAGVDILSLGDDVGMQSGPMMSVELWETWIKPRLKKVIDAARNIKPDILIFYHSCGNATLFIDGLIDCGVDILNPIQPECMNFNAIHAEFGNRLSFWGTLGTQQLMPFGTPEQVRDLSLERIRTCGSKGGLILGPTHLVEPEVPFENLVAMKKAALELYPRN
ncbi:MAG: uroporphyrinogen decarboxylase family protein [Bacteroidota bacterium]